MKIIKRLHAGVHHEFDVLCFSLHGKRSLMRKCIPILFLLIANPSFAQEDFSWWTIIHNWDGHTPWNEYMTMSTSFMGPNSLPVPEVTKGSVDSLTELELSGSYNFSRGDKTKDFYTRGFLPLYNNRVAVMIDVITYEWFETDTITRDVRAARTRSGKGGAGGDIYFTTQFQVLRDRENWPDLAFRGTFRLASGTNLRNARYTDGPGYYFDLSGGKNISIHRVICRFYAMAGFYAYQTYDLQHLQNDCFLFGAGCELAFPGWTIAQSFSGYDGYLNIGDKPLVYRMEIRKKRKSFDWKASYQWGINDYDFQRVRLGLVFHTGIIQKWLDKK